MIVCENFPAYKQNNILKIKTINKITETFPSFAHIYIIVVKLKPKPR